MVLQNDVNAHQILNNHNRHREQTLSELLEMELQEATQNFLTRTRRSYPIHYVFDLSSMEF